jgi:hypothetical protein
LKRDGNTSRNPTPRNLLLTTRKSLKTKGLHPRTGRRARIGHGHSLVPKKDNPRRRPLKEKRFAGALTTTKMAVAESGYNTHFKTAKSDKK